MKKIVVLLILVLMLTVGVAVADTLVLPEDTTVIGAEAFYGVDAETIILPDGVTTIGDRAFGGSSSLQEVYVPDSLMDREEDALEGSPNAHFVSISDLLDNYEYSISANSVTITKYKGTSSNAVIPVTIEGKQVKVIGANAFKENNNLVKVIIPEGVTEIGASAFDFCEYLTDVSFPSTLRIINARAFAYCGNKSTDIFNFFLPDGLTSIIQDGSSSDSFNNCKAVKVVTPGSETAYLLSHPSYTMSNENAFKKQWFAFAGKEGFRYLYFSENGKEVLHLMKYEGTATEAAIPGENGMVPVEIHNSAFEGNNKLKKVTIPEGICTIGDYAFKNCVLLSDVVFPDSLRILGREAFACCGQNVNDAFSFVLPDNLSSVKMAHSTTDTFYNCKAVRVVNPGSATAFLFSDSLIDPPDPDAAYPYHWFTFPGEEQKDFRYLYFNETVNNEQKRVLHLIKYLGNESEVTIPEQAEDKPYLGAIQARAFQNNNSITKLTMPDTVTVFGAFAFDGCGYLTDIHFPESLTKMERNVFTKCGNQYKTDNQNNPDLNNGEYIFELSPNIQEFVYANSNLDTFYDCLATLDIPLQSITWNTFEYYKGKINN